jgi:predicted dehydrogenase
MLRPMTSQISAAVVGTGHLGRHHVRLLAGMEGVDFIGAFDADRDRLKEITDEYGVTALPSAESAGEADAVVVATPTVSHCEVARMLLAAGCHVMVEKPITATVAEADELIERADEAQRILAVGHVEYVCQKISSSACGLVVALYGAGQISRDLPLPANLGG